MNIEELLKEIERRTDTGTVLTKVPSNPANTYSLNHLVTVYLYRDGSVVEAMRELGKLQDEEFKQILYWPSIKDCPRGWAIEAGEVVKSLDLHDRPFPLAEKSISGAKVLGFLVRESRPFSGKWLAATRAYVDTLPTQEWKSWV